MQNKAPTPGAGGSASSAGGAGGAGGGGGEGSGSGGSASGPAGARGRRRGRRRRQQHRGERAGSSSDPAHEQCTTEGHPVNVATGRVVDSAVDLRLPGAVPLVWKRDYSSKRRAERGALGPGWSHSFEEWITGDGGALVYRAGDGRSICFADVAPGETTFHRRERLSLTREGQGGFAVFSLEARLTRVFSPAAPGGAALLRAVRDAFGNAITLEYEGERLARIVDTAGREPRSSGAPAGSRGSRSGPRGASSSGSTTRTRRPARSPSRPTRSATATSTSTTSTAG